MITSEAITMICWYGNCPVLLGSLRHHQAALPYRGMRLAVIN